jgi:hypothetical protein
MRQGRSAGERMFKKRGSVTTNLLGVIQAQPLALMVSNAT